MTPKRLIECLKGSEKEVREAFMYLSEKHLKKFFSKVRNMNSKIPDLEGVVKEEFSYRFIKFFELVRDEKKFDQAGPDGKLPNPEGYFAVMLNHAGKELAFRKWYGKWHDHEVHKYDQADEAASFENEQDDEAYRQSLHLKECLKKLNENQRKIVNLRSNDPDKKTWEELGMEWDPPKGGDALKMAYNRALKKLRACMKSTN